MLHRGPVVITTLEEDFKKIGLLKDEAKKARSEEDETDTDSDEGGEGEKEMPDFIKKKMAAKSEAKKARSEEDEGEDEEDEDEGEEDEDEGEEMGEGRILKRVMAGTRGKLKRLKRTSSKLKMKAKRYYRKMKKAIKRALKKKLRMPKFRKRMAFLRQKASKRRGEGAETIANLIEDVQSIVSSIDNNPTDAMKSFANIAIIADLLSNTFVEWQAGLTEAAVEENEADEFVEFDSYIESLSDLAEAAAEAATGLSNGYPVEGGFEAMEAVFKEYMEDLLAGMDLYNVLAEADTMKGAKGMHDASTGESEEDEDEGEDEAEESKRPSKR